MALLAEVYDLVDELQELQRVEYWGIQCPEYAQSLCNDLRRKVMELPINMPATKEVILEQLDIIEKNFTQTS